MKTIHSFFSFLLLTLLLPASALAFGAIAVGDADPKAKDASSEQIFIASGHSSNELANEAALSQCRAKGLHFCHIAVWYYACSAYAKSDKESGSAWAATQDEAKRIALANCGSDCKVLATQCEPGM